MSSTMRNDLKMQLDRFFIDLNSFEHLPMMEIRRSWLVKTCTRIGFRKAKLNINLALTSTLHFLQQNHTKIRHSMLDRFARLQIWIGDFPLKLLFIVFLVNLGDAGENRHESAGAVDRQAESRFAELVTKICSFVNSLSLCLLSAVDRLYARSSIGHCGLLGWPSSSGADAILVRSRWSFFTKERTRYLPCFNYFFIRAKIDKLKNHPLKIIRSSLKTVSRRRLCW